MSTLGSIAKTAVSLLTSGSDTERLIFRKFDGGGLVEAASSGKQVSGDQVTTVILKVNPSELIHNQAKIIQKVQTNAPGKFVIFDWGTDLPVLSINGNTGNMMPDIMQSNFDPLGSFSEDLAGVINTGVQDVLKSLMKRGMSYFELLELSPKYRIFEKLRALYDTFDADLDVLTLEIGDEIYRIFFTNFSFTQTAISPWNWHYTISLSILENLSNAVRRGDDRYPNNDYVDRGN